MATVLYRLIGTHTLSLITSHLLRLAHLIFFFIFLSYFFVVVLFLKKEELNHKKTRWEMSSLRHRCLKFMKKETKES